MAIFIFLPLYAKTGHFIVDQFGGRAFHPETGYAVRELVLHAGPVLYVIVVLDQTEAPTC